VAKKKKQCGALACLALNINVEWQKKKKQCWALACLALNINVVWQKKKLKKEKKSNAGRWWFN
jgi:hypothetical protein